MIPLLNSVASTGIGGLAAPGWIGGTLADPTRLEPEFRDLLDAEPTAETAADTPAGRSLVQADHVGDGLSMAPALAEHAQSVATDHVSLWHADPAARFDSLGMFGRAGLGRVPHEAVSLAAVDLPPGAAVESVLAAIASPSARAAAATAQSALISLNAGQTFGSARIRPQIEGTGTPAAMNLLDGPPGQIVEELAEEVGAPTLHARAAFPDPRERVLQPNIAAFVESGALEVAVRVDDLSAKESADLRRQIEEVAGEQGLRLGTLKLNGRIIGVSDEGGAHGYRAG